LRKPCPATSSLMRSLLVLIRKVGSPEPLANRRFENQEVAPFEHQRITIESMRQ
jgi:hypothetical protein